jgi:hypothetical protein
MEYKKHCPTCSKEIVFSCKKSLSLSIINNCDCKQCSALKRSSKSQETKQKISQTLMGRTIPRDVVEKIRNTLKIKFNTPEYKQKFSIQNGGENNPNFGNCHDAETRNKISNQTKIAMSSEYVRNHHLESHRTKEYRNKISRLNLGRKHSCDSRMKMKGPRLSLQGENNPNFGKHRKHSDEDRRKMRIALVHRLNEMFQNGCNITYPNYNPKACEIIAEYGRQNGYNFQHALNGGEFHIKDLGYWVDGYDKEKNVVIEVDESHHNKPRYKEKDLRRQKEIKEHLGCKFIRIPFVKNDNIKIHVDCEKT